MKEKKFYYVHYYALYATSGWRPIGEAIDKHPFFYMEQEVSTWAKNSKVQDVQLSTWREITEEEYFYAQNSVIL